LFEDDERLTPERKQEAMNYYFLIVKPATTTALFVQSFRFTLRLKNK